MDKLIDRLRLNRTRVQITIGFLLVMTVVFSIAGGLVYQSTTSLFIQNTEGYLGETAKQASARVDAVLSQVDTISLQVVMDARIQSLLYRSKQGLQIPIDQKLSVRPVIDQLVALSWIIKGIDIYSVNDPFYPLENRRLDDIIGNDLVTIARLKAGQLVFVGTDPQDDQLLLAVRQVRLERDNLAPGGYVVIRVMKSLVDFFNEDFSSIKGGSMHLYDHNKLLVASTMPSMLADRNLNVGIQMSSEGVYPRLRINGGEYLHIIEHSRQFNWSIHILVPISTITEKSVLLKQLLLLALAVGTVVFLGLLWLLSRMITMPIGHLRKKMRNVHFTLPTTNEVTYFNYEMNDLNAAYNKLVREIHHLIESAYEKERLKNQAEIKMLQAQIHPHFLFNTLEALYWTLQDKQETEGAELIFHLSKLFRYSIKHSEGDDWVELQSEIEHCRRYLEIMKFRMCDRLSWDIELGSEFQRIRIPKLLIQPLVENAIGHGIEPKVEGGSIALRLQKVDREGLVYLHIQVKDNGDGMTEDGVRQLMSRLSEARSLRTAGSGIGLSNVKSRIMLHYGERCELALSSTKGAGTEVNLYLPFEELNNHDHAHSDRRG
ncbi:sensor histidine kinase [Paenibacillus cremeus]|uniref:histidine kinase n=1 Tax=Paenibacillus cremeus TaxID=2163881 RepID=A0A559K9Y9_9BACL|nr:histidine kinase [Paenibacillus cremeus]TVY08951.1 sensor histidine kinase [Paenibacillus cremeus]